MKWVTLQSSCSPAAPGERSVSDSAIECETFMSGVHIEDLDFSVT